MTQVEALKVRGISSFFLLTCDFIGVDLLTQEELRRMERSRDRERHANLEYLKNIVLAFVTSHDRKGRSVGMGARWICVDQFSRLS